MCRQSFCCCWRTIGLIVLTLATALFLLFTLHPAFSSGKFGFRPFNRIDDSLSSRCNFPGGRCHPGKSACVRGTKRKRGNRPSFCEVDCDLRSCWLPTKNSVWLCPAVTHPFIPFHPNISLQETTSFISIRNMDPCGVMVSESAAFTRRD